MTSKQSRKYRDQLLKLAARIQGDLSSLEEEASASTGGPAVGNLSNAPTHPAELGTAEFMRELDATLLENEEALSAEVADALRRLDDGSFGLCERCGAEIRRDRLDALPYTRYCVPCAEAVQAGTPPPGLDVGRP